MVSVLVVSDQSLQRLALHMLLAAEPALTVVGEAEGGDEAVRTSIALGPDVVLLDGHLPSTDSINTIRIVAAGEVVITPTLARALIDIVRRQRTNHPLTRACRPDTLTERRRDVIIAVASGWSNAEIAESPSIAPTTVKTHVSNVLAKIGASTRVQGVTFAYESGLLRPAA